MKDEELKNYHTIETYKSMIQFGMFGLRLVLIINGGAMIALLAFLGNIANKNFTTPNLQNPMYAFIAGIMFAGIATLGAYLTQYNVFNEDMNRIEKGAHKFWFRFTIILLLVSIVCFCLGSFLSISSFDLNH